MACQKVAVVLLAVSFFLFSIQGLQSQDLGLDQLEQKQRGNLEVYLDHADQAQTQAEWLRIAQFGVQTVVALWERGAAQLVDQGIDLPSEREKLEGDLNGLLEERFARWLIEKAFAAEAHAQSVDLDRAVLQTNLQKLYITDQNGIQYDAAGDPRMYQADNIDADRTAWNETVSQALRAQLEAWDEHAAAVRTELLGYLPEGTAFEDQFTATEEQYRAAYQRELNTVFQREQSRFLNSRQRDSLSLRSKSEQGTAASIASQIIAQANADVASGLQELRDSLSTAHAATPDGEIAIDPAAWQDSFQREFDRGMARWSKAEQDLLVQRAQWERSVADQFRNGEKEWADAYRQLQDARTQWERQLSEELNTGRLAWETKQADLTAAIDQARTELQESIDERTRSLDATISNAARLANQSANVLRTAQSSLDYWNKQMETDKTGEATGQVDFWTATKNTYLEYYDQALSYLADTATVINGGAAGSLSYTDILGTDAVDARYLDDYQVALLGAKATQAYWQKQVEIAEAVAAYARETSSARDTEAVTAQKYDDAQKAFAARQSAYNDALAALQDCGGDIQEKRMEIQSLNDELQKLDGQLKDARDGYQAAFDMLSTDNDVYFREQLQGYYQDLYMTSGLAEAEKDTRSQIVVYADYLAAVSAYGMEQQVYGAAQAVSRLVLGDPAAGQASLTDVLQAATRAEGWTFRADSHGDFLASLADLGLDQTDAGTAAIYEQLAGLYGSYENARGADDRALARLQIVGFADQIVEKKQDELNGRLAEIALLTTADIGTWAAGQGLAVTSGVDFSAVRSLVEKTAAGSSAQSYLDEATAEKAILTGIAEGDADVAAISDLVSSMDVPRLSGATAEILISIFGGETGDLSATEAARRVDALQKVIDAMSAVLASGTPDLPAHAAEIGRLAQSDELVRCFLAGSSMFTFEGIDYAGLLLTTARRKAASSQYLAQLLARDAHTAPAIQQALSREAVASLQNLLVQKGIASAVSGDTVSFRNAVDVFDDVWKTAGGKASVVEGWLSGVQEDIVDLSADLPQPVISQIQSVMEYVGEVFALRLQNLGKTASASEDTSATIKALSDRMQTLQADFSQIQGRNPDPASDPAALLAALRSVQIIQSSSGFDSSTNLSVALTSADVSARFVAEAAVSIAAGLYAKTGGASASSVAIQSAVDDYLSSNALRTLVSDPVIAPFVPGITTSLRAATAAVMTRVMALSNPTAADWAAVGQQMRIEYADSVWNARAPEWFAGVNDGGARDTLTAVGRAQIEVLHSIYDSLAGSWGPDGVDQSRWNNFLISSYYGGKTSSLTFDQGLDVFEEMIGLNGLSGITVSLLGAWTPSTAVLSSYFSAAGIKAAVDQALDGQPYNADAAKAAVEAYFDAHPDARTAGTTAFVSAYLSLYDGTAGAVSVADQKPAWLRLLRNQLGGATLSTLSQTTQFLGVAAVELIGSAADALAGAGLSGYDFGLLKDVLVDSTLSEGERALLAGIDSPGGCASALDAYLSALQVGDTALSGDGTDRSFALDLLYAQGYLNAGNVSARRSFRQAFRGQYLSGTLDKLEVALGCADDVRTLGSAEKDAWFSSQVLSSAGAQRVSAVTSADLADRSGIDANERSLAIGLNYDLSRVGLDEGSRIALTEWMLSISGLKTPAHLDTLIQQADGNGSGTAPTRDALLFLLGCPEAALWILKRKILSGKSIDGDRTSVDSATWIQAQAFQAELASKNGYVAAAQEGALQYGAGSEPGGFENAVEAGALASAGAWDDEAFVPSAGSSASDILGFLSGIQSSRTKVALDYIGGVLGSQLGAMARSRQGLEAKLAFDRQVEDLSGGLGSSPLAYRAYVNTALMQITGDNAAEAGKQHLAQDAKGVPSQADDANGLYFIAPLTQDAAGVGPLYQNAILEALNQLCTQANRFNAAVQSELNFDRSLSRLFYSSFATISSAARSINVSALLSGWDSSSGDLGFVPTGASRAAAVAAQTALRGLETETANDRRQIVAVGSALALYLADSQAGLTAATKDLKARIAELNTARTAKNDEYNAAVDGFESASSAYTDLYKAATDSMSQLEAERANLQKAEAIQTFASTGYLNVDTGAVESGAPASEDQNSISLAVDPNQRLAAAQAGLLRSQAAFDALSSLFGEEDQPADFVTGSDPAQVAYLADFKEYQKQYGAYLAMERLSALMGSAVASQQEAVREAQKKVDDQIAMLLGQKSEKIDFEEPSTDKYNINRFVQVTTTTDGLPEFTFGALSDQSEKDGLSSYLTGAGEGTYSQDRKTWVSAISDYVRAHGTGFLEEWALALQYQMSQLTPPSDLDADAYQALFSSYLYDEQKVSGAVADTLSKEGISWAPGFSARAMDAFNKLKADSTQWKLYQFFVAMDLLGQTQKGGKDFNSGTLTSRYMTEAITYLDGQLESKEQGHYHSALILAIDAGVQYGLAAVWAWCPPVAVTFTVLGDISGGLALNENYNAVTAAAAQETLNSTLTSAATDGEARVESVSDDYRALSDALTERQNALSSMLGKREGTAGIDADTVMKAITEAAADPKELDEILTLANNGISDPAQKLTLTGLVSRYIDAAKNGAHPATDVDTAISDMLNQAQTLREDALEKLETDVATLSNKQAALDAAYKKAVNDLAAIPVPDPAHPSAACLAAQQQVQLTARAAYGAPLYRSNDHHNRLLGMQESFKPLVNPGEHADLDQAQQDLLDSEGKELQSMWEDRNSSYMAAQENAWALMQKNLTDQQNQWQASMMSIMKRAGGQWDEALRALDQQHTQWQGAFENAYEDRAGAWETAYVKLETTKASWVTDAANKAAQVGSQAVLTQLGQTAESGARDATTLLVSDLGLEPPDATGVVASLLAGRDFGSLLKGGTLLNRGIGSVGTEIFAQLGPDIFQTASVLRKVVELNAAGTAEIDRRVLMITAREARKSVEEAASQMNEQVGQANESVADGLNRTLEEAGFRRNGDHYERETVVDSDILGPLTELHVVPAFKTYVPEEPIAPTVDLSEARLLQLSGQGIQGQVDLAIREMSGQLTKIFGKADEKGSVKLTTWTTKTDNVRTYQVQVQSPHGAQTVTQTVTEYYTTRDQGTTTSTDVGGGKFGEWVGVAPEFDNQNADCTAGESEISKYLSQEGSGQMGLVITSFMWSQMKQGMGWASVGRPIYDQKLWDDRGSWVKAPTMRSVADVGVAVLGTALGGWGGLVVGLAEKGLFAAADVANGVMTWDEGLVSFGKSALSSVFSLGMGQLGKVVGDSLNAVTSFSGTIAKTMWAGAQGLMTNMGEGLINSVSYSSGVGFGFNSAAFADSVVGQQAVAGYLGSVGGAATDGLLAGNLSGFSGLDAAGVQSVSNLAGGLVNSGIQYGMTGEATFNVLNFADLSGNRNWNTGLVEMHVGGSQGFSMNLGVNGTDISLGTIGAAMSGMGTFMKQQQFRLYNAFGVAQFADSYTGGRDVATLMRENYSFGDAEAQVQLDRLLSGQDTLRVGYIDNEGKTTAVGASRVVDLATLGTSGNINSQLAAGIALGHEAHRNGINDGVLGQAWETNTAVLAHTQMALRVAGEYGTDFISGNQNLRNDVSAYVKGPEAFANYVGAAYDSSADYWLFKKDGRLINDHRTGLRQELADGSVRTIVDDSQEQSVAAALVHYLGAGRANQLLNREYGDPFNRGDLSGQVSLYDNQTLRDVLHLSDVQIAAVRNNPSDWQSALGNASALDRDRLIGEALMKGNGITASGGQWLGDGNGFTFSDNRFADITIGLRRLPDGQLEKFTVSAEAIRSSDAFNVLRWNNGAWQENLDYARNTTITFSKRDLDGNVLDTYDTGTRWNTVDNTFGARINNGQVLGADQRTSQIFLGLIQGNTVNSDLMIHLTPGGSQYGVDQLFAITNAYTIAGEYIGSNSLVSETQAGRWLWHPAGLGRVDGCWGTLNDVGYEGDWRAAANPGSGAYNFQQVTNYLQDQMGVYNGLNMSVQLRNRDFRAWTGWRW